MLFRNDEASLRLDIARYEFPDVDPGSEDNNWLVVRATWIDENGGLVKDSNSCLQTFELQSLTAGLKVLKAGIRDHYVSDFQEDAYFSLSARAEGDRFRFHVSFYLPNTMDGDDTAELTCSLTIEELGALIDELDRLCEKFPDRT